MKHPSPETILCVEDDASTRFAFALVLQAEGFEVRQACSGAEGLRLAAEQPDLIILDVQLPDLSGFEVCARLKADPATAAVPVLHLSGEARTTHDKAEGLGGGADGYLTKPVEAVELVAHVKALLRARRAERAARASAEQTRQIIQTAYEAFVAVDASGAVVEWNHEAERTFGWSHGEAAGRPLTELIVPRRYWERHNAGLARRLASEPGPVWHARLEVSARHKEGHEFPAELRLSMVGAGEDRLVNAFIRDLTAVKQAERRRAVHQAVTHALVESATLGQAITKILQAVCQITGWDAGAVWRVDQPAGLLRCIETWAGPGVDAAEFHALTQAKTLAPGADLPGRVWTTREPAWAPVVVAGENRGDNSIRAALAFPVPFGPEVTGVIEFFSRRPRPPDDLLSLLGVPSAQIGQFFERKRAEEAQAEGARLTAFAAAVGVALTQGETLRAMLAGCTEAMVRCLDVALARIWTLDAEAGVLDLRASAGLYTHLDGAHSQVAVGSHESGLIASQRRPYWTNDVAHDPRIAEKDWAAAEGLTTFAGWPLSVGDQLIGVLAVFARSPFSAMALQALGSAADNIALGIQRRAAQLALRASEEEFRAARRIQQKLFPRAGSVNTPGFEVEGASFPTVSTGGDYYDFFPLADGTLGVVIGDVSGHGVGSALLMASTRAYLRALALTHSDVSAMLALANRAVADDTEDQFVTLTLARLDPARRSFEYASAGHPPGFVLNADGRVRARLDSTGMPLGVVPTGDFPCGGPATLAAGEIVVFLTDGVVETRSPDETPFGLDRALAIVRLHRREPAARIVENLLHTVRAFARDRPPPDDVSALIVKATSPGE